jgi:hypothetical protein
MTTVFIYGLCDPRTEQLRYVGKTTNLSRRLYEHTKNKSHSHLSSWIRSLLGAGYDPEIFVIEEVDKKNWQREEKFWISYFRYIGADLVNGSQGGLGGSKKGHKFSLEGRRRIDHAVRKSCKGKPLSREHRRKLSLAKIGTKQSRETIEKRINSLSGSGNPNYGKTLSEEHKMKISKAKKGKPGHPQTKETIEKISAAQRGRKKSYETRMRMSEGQKNKEFSDEHRKNLSEAMKRVWQERKSILGE